ncbi:MULTISPECIES: hypothetical protein [Burkholderiaceae]|uniref:hypothetical protein n=1 Tax=Burkholderiaceae TaxID=119060 RepID=UPI000AAC51B4|nr:MULTISPECIES: hypothetical protein [Burkholderiaceae]
MHGAIFSSRLDVRHELLEVGRRQAGGGIIEQQESGIDMRNFLAAFGALKACAV